MHAAVLTPTRATHAHISSNPLCLPGSSPLKHCYSYSNINFWVSLKCPEDVHPSLCFLLHCVRLYKRGTGVVKGTHTFCAQAGLMCRRCFAGNSVRASRGSLYRHPLQHPVWPRPPGLSPGDHFQSPDSCCRTQPAAEGASPC